MMRLPLFTFHAPRTVQEAAELLVSSDAMLVGGNLCLDTRCNYYDQNYEWRKAIDFCMKKDGETCWVATSSPKCLAVSSTDTAPALIALGAEVTLTRAGATRRIAVSELFQNDG